MKKTAPTPIPARFQTALRDEADRLLDDLAAMPRPKNDLEVARKARAIIVVHKLLETLYRDVPEAETAAPTPPPAEPATPPILPGLSTQPPAFTPPALPGFAPPAKSVLSRVNAANRKFRAP